MGLIEKDGSVDVRWSKEKEHGNVARSSVLMRPIVIDNVLIPTACWIPPSIWQS